MTSKATTPKATMYRQGSGWIVIRWSDDYGRYTTSNEMTYWQARTIVGETNRAIKGGVK